MLAFSNDGAKLNQETISKNRGGGLKKNYSADSEQKLQQIDLKGALMFFVACINSGY